MLHKLALICTTRLEADHMEATLVFFLTALCYAYDEEVKVTRLSETG